MSDVANTTTPASAFGSLRVNFLGWFLLPAIGVLLCLVLHLFLVLRAGIPLVLWLVWAFPFYNSLATFSRTYCGMNLAVGIILYAQSLWIGALYFYLRDLKLRSIIAAGISVVFLAASLLCGLWTALQR